MIHYCFSVMLCLKNKFIYQKLQNYICATILSELLAYKINFYVLKISNCVLRLYNCSLEIVAQI